MASRTIAIGDVHGCSAALAALIDPIDPGPQDTLVTLGDYIDRGPDSRGVLDLLIGLATRCRLVPLLGNHEEMLFAALGNRSTLRFWLGCGGKEMLASYGRADADNLEKIVPEEHWAFLAACRNWYETDTHFFVHAGYDPDLPLPRQSLETLRWQFTDRKTARPHCSGKVAVVGHTPQRSGDILDLGFLVCIDTGCHAGGWLTALDVDSGQVWQADRRRRLRDVGRTVRKPSRDADSVD
jgi:serine/threonine protein phosphatase 1